MKNFVDDNFLLNNDLSIKLYNEIKSEPILDYHNHLNVDELASNKKFSNLTELWLKSDHYKWRQMRTCGVSEDFITGNKDDFEKFEKFVECLEMMQGNPVSQWCQLELKIYFNIEKPLILKNAKEIWDTAIEKLKDMSCRTFLEKSNVYSICTTDDPIDNLEQHNFLKKDWKEVKVIPNFRPDKVIKINDENFVDYIRQLSNVSGKNIFSFDSLMEALENRIDFFHNMGGRSADHGLSSFNYEHCIKKELNSLFMKRLAGERLSDLELAKYTGNLMYELAKIYYKKNWVMLWHINCDRDNNPHLLKAIGHDVGADSVAEHFVANQLNAIFKKLKQDNLLGKHLLFSLNRMNWNAIATLAGNFQDNEDEIKGKIQLGTAWWFADTFSGNKEQIITFAELQSLGVNVGMLTDSRAYSSFARHDYYRRLLCDIVGEWAEKGMCVNDWDILVKLLKNISFKNAQAYFGY
ncbi:glucuronate isomerase [Spiroplasma apis]|uniref:Uronate isomerase n=1 Tax=Spiroplasma apis B31 TaxID=1276258 RepID=V5RHX4_SPIAP|nr:glucuronate isomerase [Spiroplasma apis]AHB36287.1 glucuronate isomerase [Spiroplasma apis B31]